MNGNHSYKEAIVDALIAAGSAFFGALTGVAILAIRSDPGTYLLAGGVAAGVAFFGSMAAAVHRPAGGTSGTSPPG